MFALSHSLTHRGPGASSRARSRWQPYASSSITPTRSPASYLNTPASIVSSSPPHSSRIVHVSQDIARQTLKTRYVSCLIDQTVKSLCEIWPSTPITTIPSITSVSISPVIPQECIRPPNIVISTLRNMQLPSPISPTTNATPPYSPLALTTSTSRTASCSNNPPSSPVPLKNFVQEVLRRSRTSGSVLQTALCYLEAVRRKVPEIAREDNLSTFQQENSVYPEDVPSPERPLSSPLLCPRRTFLASLILASKFLQDRCYSNRAWAKLSGLSPREIGRCEKALGDALEWRLWVGKSTGKSLVRSRSEHNILAVSAAGTAKGTAGRMLSRARTVPCIGSGVDSDSPALSTNSITLPQPQLDPYQEWLAINQDRLLQEDLHESSIIFSNNVDDTPMECILGFDSMPTPPTPGLTMSPTSTICSSASVSSFDSDEGERTLQICDVADPFPSKLSAGCGWHVNKSKNDVDIGLFNISAPNIVRLDSVGNQAWY